MLVFLLCTGWQRAQAQKTEQIITFNSNSATLQQFIGQVKSQQGLEFTFDQDVSTLMSKKVTIRKKKVTVGDALKWLNVDLAIRYKVIDNYIILSLGRDKPATADRKAHISGKIVDETQEPLPGATIKVV